MVDRSDLVPLKLADYDFVLAIQIFIINKVYEMAISMNLLPKLALLEPLIYLRRKVEKTKSRPLT